MSTALDPSRLEYIRLIKRYLNNEINEESYGAHFQELVRRHNALEDEKKASWPERYDLKIEKDYYDGKITVEECNERLNQLWGGRPDWFQIVYSDLLYLGDRRPGSEEILQSFQHDSDEYNRTYFLTEDQFKDELRKFFNRLEACKD